MSLCQEITLDSQPLGNELNYRIRIFIICDLDILVSFFKIEYVLKIGIYI